MIRVTIAALALVGAVLVAPACLDDPEARQTVLCPNEAIFSAYVSPLMERRCGMLDCHGNFQRPMRLYGELGLRHPKELNRTGENATTPAELTANYNAVCGLEPELVTEVASQPGGQAVNKLLLVRKGRGQEGHKGGNVFTAFDDADLCVVGWVRGDNVKSVYQACQRALDKLPGRFDLPPP
jgi:hypothetical protein